MNRVTNFDIALNRVASALDGCQETIEVQVLRACVTDRAKNTGGNNNDANSGRLSANETHLKHLQTYLCDSSHDKPRCQPSHSLISVTAQDHAEKVFCPKSAVV